MAAAALRGPSVRGRAEGLDTGSGRGTDTSRHTGLPRDPSSLGHPHLLWATRAGPHHPRGEEFLANIASNCALCWFKTVTPMPGESYINRSETELKE